MTLVTGPEETPCPLCGKSILRSSYDTTTLYSYGPGGTDITMECDYTCRECGGMFRGTVHATADWGYMSVLEDGDYGEEFDFDYDGEIRPSKSQSRRAPARRTSARKAPANRKTATKKPAAKRRTERSRK